MPSGQPTPKELHVDALLTFLSIAYMNEATSYIADKIYPIISVRKQSDLIAVYRKGDWFRDEAQERAPGTESEGSGWNVEPNERYSTRNYAIHKDIPDELRENADQPYDPDREATMFVVDKLLMKREKSWVVNHFTTGLWGTDVAGGVDFDQWSDYSSSQPIIDVENGREAIFSSTAKEINTAVISRAVWVALKHHPDLIELIKYTQRGILTAEIIGAILELPRILIAKAIENTAAEGQTEVMSYMYGKHVLLAYVNPSPSLMTPSAGYTFHWNRFGGISFIRRLRHDFNMYDRIEGHTHFDQKLIAADCGYFLEDAVA